MLADGGGSTTTAGVTFAFIAGPVVILLGVIAMTDYRGIASWHQDKVWSYLARSPFPSSAMPYKVAGLLAILFGIGVIILGFYGLSSPR